MKSAMIDGTKSCRVRQHGGLRCALVAAFVALGATQALGQRSWQFEQGASGVTTEDSLGISVTASGSTVAAEETGDDCADGNLCPPNPDDLRDLLRELPDDPYRPASIRRATSPAQVWTRNGFRSIQVNVDANGNNIVGDAANEPSIAVDPTDRSRMAIGWRQFDTIESNFRQAGWGYTQDKGQTWTFPGVIEPGIFRSDPVLDADADGNFYYYSLTIEDTFLVHMFKSTDGGVTWGERVYAFGGDKAWIAIDRTNGPGRGHIYAKWSLGASCCAGDFTRSTDGGASFEPTVSVPESPFWGTLSVGPDGELYISSIFFDSGSVVLRSDNAQHATKTPTFEQQSFVNLGGHTGFSAGPNPRGLLGQTWIATDHSDGSTRGNVYVLASVHTDRGDPLDVMFARSTDGGVTWSDPIRVNDDPSDASAWQWFGTMSVAPNGRIDVVWNDNRNTDAVNLSELYYSSSFDGGLTWSPNVAISPVFDSHIGWPQQNKIGDYYDMVSDLGGADLAYAATFNGEQDVYYLRISFDCNGNGIHDAEDLVGGLSQDCDGNLIPDECDIAEGRSGDCNNNAIPDTCETDCNHNGFHDRCDLAEGVSSDCNGNFVPDECEIGAETDCNENGIPDECDRANGTDLPCAIMELVPTGSSGPFVIQGNKLFIPRGDVQVEFEIRVSGWGKTPGSPSVGAYTVRIPTHSFKGDNATPKNPGVDLLLPRPQGCSTANDCVTPTPPPVTQYSTCGVFEDHLCDDSVAAFVVSHVCLDDLTKPCRTSLDCTAGSFCLNNPDYLLFRAGLISPLVRLSADSIAWDDFGTSGQSDDGVSKYYAGTLRLIVPSSADGSYPIRMDRHRTILNKTNGRIGPVSIIDGLLVIGRGACCMADRSCEFLDEETCNAAGGTFAFGLCEGDPDNDGVVDPCAPTIVNLDIKPGSCPNPVNPKSRGVVPVAIVGSETFDVNEIDVSSVVLGRADGVGTEITPATKKNGCLHASIEDAATPFEATGCDCHDVDGVGVDGIDDLSLKFSTSEMTSAFGLKALRRGEPIELVLRGSLHDGTAFEATDCIVIPGAPRDPHRLSRKGRPR